MLWEPLYVNALEAGNRLSCPTRLTLPLEARPLPAFFSLFTIINVRACAFRFKPEKRSRFVVLAVNDENGTSAIFTGTA
jgi:hypothetical protein